MLAETAVARERSLVMIDEAGGGTDPAQGAALARALLEKLLENGARVVSTTHCMQLKNWAVEDDRTEIAAMEYRKGRPTFRLTRNAIGESHAIETARRLKLPADMIDRAEALLSEDQRSLLQLQRKAEQLEKDLQARLASAEEREAEATSKAEKLKKDLEETQDKAEYLKELEGDLLRKQEFQRTQLLEEHEMRLKAHEDRLGDILSGLNGGEAQSDSRVKIVGHAMEELRLERDEAADDAAKAKAAARAVPGALAADAKLSIGDPVVVLARTSWYGFKGRVVTQIQGVPGMPARVKIRLGSGNMLELLITELGKGRPPRTAAEQKQIAKKQAAANTRDYSMSQW